MNLFEKANMIKVYNKNIKKSICNPQQIDLFLILALLVLIISPFIINFFLRLNAEVKQINLSLSPRFTELFGKELTEKLLKEFEGQNPNLHIRLQDIQNDKNSDIFIFDDGEYTSLSAGGALADLDSFFNYDAGGGMPLAVPLVSFMDMLFYNIDVLTIVGFDRPPKTREEFLSYARAVSNSDDERLTDTVGAAFSLGSNDNQALSRDIFSWIWAAGGNFWLEENKPALNIKAVSDDISFLRSLYNERMLAPGIFNTTGEQRLYAFVNGRVAMMAASAKYIPYFRERMGDKSFGITTFPSADGNSDLPGKYNINLSGIYAGINAGCKYPDKAWSFILFLAERSSLFSEMLKAVPGVVSNIFPGDYVKNDPFYSKAWDIFESSEVVQGFSGNPKAGKYENAFLEELQAFFRSNRTAQETVTAIQRRWDAVNEQ